MQAGARAPARCGGFKGRCRSSPGFRASAKSLGFHFLVGVQSYARHGPQFGAVFWNSVAVGKSVGYGRVAMKLRFKTMLLMVKMTWFLLRNFTDSEVTIERKLYYLL